MDSERDLLAMNINRSKAMHLYKRHMDLKRDGDGGREGEKQRAIDIEGGIEGRRRSGTEREREADSDKETN